MNDKHPTFFSWLDFGHPLDFMFTQEQLNDWYEALLMMCHWYFEMDSKCTSHHEEEHRKSIEPAYFRQQPTTAIEAPGKGCGSKPKTTTGKTTARKEPPSKEQPTKNPLAKALARAMPTAKAYTKANDRPASLHSASPIIGDGWATIEKARLICRMDTPGGEALCPVEQSTDLTLTNLVQITAPSILLNWDGPTYSIQLALKICISDEDDFEEHLINTNGMNLHFPPPSENFIRFVRMANGGRLSYLNDIE